MKKLIDFINRYSTVIEFVLAVFFAFSIYKIAIIKHYQGFFPIKYIFAAVLFVAYTIWIVYNHIKKDKTAIEKIVISFLIPVGMLYIFFIPPTCVPDENAHMQRAYEVSTGRFITAQPEDTAPVIEIPVFLEENTLDHLNSYQQYNAAMYEKTDYNNLIPVQTTAAGYFGISYVFSGLGFLLGRIFNINGILTFYFARMLNYAFYVFSIYIAIKIIPAGKVLISVFAFMPMALQQAASVSADSVLDSCAILFAALTLYVKCKEGRFSAGEKIVYSILSITIMLSKIAYFPLLGISLLLIDSKNKEESLKRRWIYLIINVVIAIGLGALWYKYAQNYLPSDGFVKYYSDANVNSAEQIQMILSQPRIFVKALFNLVIEGAFIPGTIGRALGWLNIFPGEGIIIMFMIMLVLSAFMDKNSYELEPLEKIWFWIITISVYFIVFTGFYITWTGVGAETVAGVQGRYFIPVFLLPLLALGDKKRYIKFNNQIIILPSILAILNMLTLYSVIEYFMV